MKGGIVGIFADIAVGVKVAAQGLWNTITNTLSADHVKVNLQSENHETTAGKTTLEGKVKSVNPLVMTSGGTDYTVNIASDTSVLNALWLRLPIASVSVGDTIRVYGKVNTNATIDATVVRDTNIR